MEVFSLHGIVMAFQGCYTILASFFGYGFALIAFAFIISTALLPIVKWAVKISKKETKLQSVIAPQITEYKNKYKGAELSNAIARLYKRYSYNPLLSIRQSMQAIIQIPVLILAYVALSNYFSIEGKSFLFFDDLSKPDGLLFGISVMPFVMTFINCMTVKLGNFSKKEQKTSYLIAFLFLILLYSAPVALLIYWTTNNFYNFMVTLTKKLKVKKSKLLSTNKSNSKRELGAFAVALSILVPASFVWANNVNFLSLRSIIFCLGLLILVAVFLYLILSKLSKILKRKKHELLFNLFCVLLCSLLSFWLGSTLRTAFQEYKYLIFIVTIAVFYLLYFVSKFKLVNFIFLMLVVFNTLSFFYNVQSDNNDRTAYLETANSNSAYNLKFTNKPNVYYFLLESLNSGRVLNNVYNLDISSYNNSLENLGYKVYDNIYSNRNFTLGTLKTLMSMDSNYETKGNMDGGSYIRDIISGGAGNNLIRLLKFNGYFSSLYLNGEKYFGYEKGNYLDFYDNFDEYSRNIFTYLQPIFVIQPKLEAIAKTILPNLEPRIPLSENIVKNYTHNLDHAVPQAFFNKVGYSDHTSPWGDYSYKNKKSWSESDYYKNGVKREFEAVIDIAKTISENDPNAVVVFLGDHGAGRLRGYPLEKSPSEIEAFAKNDGENLNSVVDDFFSVYAAIKMPKGYEAPDEFSSVNVFLEIFSILNPTVSRDINKIKKENIIRLSNNWNAKKIGDKLIFKPNN